MQLYKRLCQSVHFYLFHFLCQAYVFLISMPSFLPIFFPFLLILKSPCFSNIPQNMFDPRSFAGYDVNDNGSLTRPLSTRSVKTRIYLQNSFFFLSFNFEFTSKDFFLPVLQFRQSVKAENVSPRNSKKRVALKCESLNFESIFSSSP